MIKIEGGQQKPIFFVVNTNQLTFVLAIFPKFDCQFFFWFVSTRDQTIDNSLTVASVG